MRSDRRAYVWVWLPGATEPVVAGRLDPVRGARAGAPPVIDFVYGRSYLERLDAVPLYLPELPLRRGRIRPVGDLTIPGVIADAGPDIWGRRVVLRRISGRAGRDDLDQLDDLTYLLESGSDRSGAIDFQESATVYEPRGDGVLEDLVETAARVDEGAELGPALRDALFGAPSLGGARPKVALVEGDRSYVVKLSSRRTPTRSCAPRRSPWTSPGGSASTLRVAGSARGSWAGTCCSSSASTVHPAVAGAWSCPRSHCSGCPSMPPGTPRTTSWRTRSSTGSASRPRPCTSSSAGSYSTSASATPTTTRATTPPSGTRRRELRAPTVPTGCVERADVYRLTSGEAREVVDHQLHVINTQFGDAADAAGLTAAERTLLWGRQILNPYALDGYP